MFIFWPSDETQIIYLLTDLKNLTFVEFNFNTLSGLANNIEHQRCATFTLHICCRITDYTQINIVRTVLNKGNDVDGHMYSFWSIVCPRAVH